jgi:hypothetical protein
VSGELAPMWDSLPLLPAHAAFLAAQAIEPDVAAQHGLRSITAVDDLPEEFADYGEQAVPALLYPWTEPDGTVVHQLRVPDGRVKVDGRYAKYLWAAGKAAKLGAVRPDDTADRILIVEGTKQSLAAASYAPAGTAVYGIAGCRMWSSDGVPTPHLAVADGREVYVILDADAASNPDVYNAGLSLAEALTDQGATSVRFVRLAAGKKAGLDDVLGAQPRERRALVLARMLEKTVKAGRKAERPADVKPRANARRRTAPLAEQDADRPLLVVNGDKLKVINDLTDVLQKRWGGERLFSFGGVPAARKGASMVPLTKDSFARVIAETVRTVARSGSEGQETDVDAWPDERTLGAVMAEPDAFPILDRISRVPFVRADGTLCQESGYDEATRTYLVLDDELADVRVPDEPTAGDVRAAVSLLTGDLLQGFPFPDPSSQANALALLLTPFIRGLVPLVPLAVVDGKEAGSGKNLFADAVSILATGRAAQPLPYTTDDAEQRKVITSAFRSGAEMFVFDEAHRLDGASFARALTSVTYQDRVLGVSTLAEFPNRITWMSLGNQVQLAGDMGRRVYRIALAYPGASPENRPDSDFKHPDLREWAAQQRARLVEACLTLVRAWFAAGCPRASSTAAPMGSFEQWQKIVGGVLAHAGVEGFLENVKAWRSESDHDRAHWVEHLRWLRETFGDATFTTAQVIKALDRDPVAEHPPNLEDTSGKSYPRQLGYAYAKNRDRVLDGHTLIKTDETGHGRVTKWAVRGPDTPAEGTDPFAEPEAVAPAAAVPKPPAAPEPPDPFAVPEPFTAPDDVPQPGPPAAPFIPRPRDQVESSGPPPNAFTRHLRHLAPPAPSIPCEDCDTPLTLVPPANLVYRCARCHPNTLIRSD